MMEDVPLPQDGPALVAGVQLPAGQRIYGGDDDGGDTSLVAWVTSRPMADAGYAWLALSDAHPQTGLVPVLASRAANMDGIDGEAFMFSGAEDIGMIDSLNVREILAAQWDVGEEETFDARAAKLRDPFGPKFPGLAPAQHERLPMAALHQAVATQQPAFLALVGARRAADVPAAVGWSGFGIDWPGTPRARCLEIAAVLRSWASRFGARPLRIGSDCILRVLVERPPATVEAAIPVAAEHMAFADEFGSHSGISVRQLAAELAGRPIWHFWWD
jgi:hypothetical protein